MPGPLAQRIRAKYPDAYTDLTDAQLEQAVTAKYPGVYDDLLKSSEPAERTWADTAKDVAKGAGVLSPVGAFVGLGNLFQKIPGVSTAVDTLYGKPGLSDQAFTEAKQAVTPQNTAQAVGKLAGDIGQIIVPGNTITRTATALAAKAPRGLQLATRVGVEGIAGGGISAVQGGDPTTGAVLSGAIPVVGKSAGAVSSRLKAAVPAHVMKALGPTKEKYKAMAERITPGIISRKLGGSREQLKTQAHEAAQEAGQAIDVALTTEYGGKVLNVQSVQDALEQTKRRYLSVVTDRVPDEAAGPLPASFRSQEATVDQLWSDVLSDAKRRGHKGSLSDLRATFDAAVRDAKTLAKDVADLDTGVGTPKGLLTAIAKNGGIGRDANVGMPGEIRQLWEHSTGMAIGKGTRKGTSVPRKSRQLSGGAIGGVSGVMKHDGKNLEQMVEALREDGFAVTDVNDLLNQVESARVSLMRPAGDKPLGYWLEGVGVKPGVNWWGAAESPTKTVVLDARPVKQIQKLQDILSAHGSEMTVDQLVAVRRVWDEVVEQAGGFAHRAPGGIGVPLKDATEAWAKRKATTAIRQLLDENFPQYTALNKEFSFWQSLDDVLTQTLKRTQPQGPGLKSIAAEGAGRLAGALNPAAGVVGTVSKVWVLGKIVKMADAAFSSPRWQFATARMKDDLADAIVNGKLDKAASTLARILSVQASKVPAAVGAN